MIDEQDGPVNYVPKDVLLSWAGKDIPARFPWLAGEIRLFEKASQKNDLRWSEIALYLLEHATDRQAVLAAFGWHMEPHSWSGSLADVLTPYLQLIRELFTHPDSTVREWAKSRERQLLHRIDEERIRDRRTDSSFE